MKDVDGRRYKRTLYVGLGGAGAKTLTKLKKKILDANGQKIPKQIKFLLIDTNATELSNYNNFDASEKICIAVREPYERYKTDEGRRTHEFIPSRNSYSLIALERGAGQVRSNGHFAVIENQYSNKLMRVFKERADELMNIDINRAALEKDPKIEVRIIFSLAGGTGSGTFLPISILLRAALKHCELIAYAISPAHYERVIENSAKKTVMANGYAALAELDYMMHFGRNGLNQENIKFNYGPDVKTQQIEQCDRPFDEVYYIDKRTNLPLSDSIEYTYTELNRMFENTADIIHIASTNIISGHTGTVDNVRQKIREGQFDVEDKFGWVSGVGMAEIYLNPKDRNSREIVEAGIKQVRYRLNGTDSSKVKSLVSSFINDEWNESNDSNDHNRVLTHFVDESSINDFCHDQIIVKANDVGTKVEALNINLNTLSSVPIEELENERLETYESYLNDKVVNFINKEDKIDGKIVPTSLILLKNVIDGIAAHLQTSVKRLSLEADAHMSLCHELDDKREACLKNGKAVDETTSTTTTKKKGFFKRLFSNSAEEVIKIDNTKSTNNIEDQIKKAKIAQRDALVQLMLAERAKVAGKLLNKCREITLGKAALVESFINMLSKAEIGGESKQLDIKNMDNAMETENRIEVKMAEVHDGYFLDYEKLLKIHNFVESKIEKPDGKSIFEMICEMLSADTGSLQKYLIKCIQEIDSEHGNYKTKGRQEKTECQKAIDRLIDLSAPTLQIDSHGYGAKIKADQFYYIMTSDDDIVFSDSQAELGQSNKDSVFNTIKHKTVAGLLQYLLEQNSLDIHVQRVNVRGWENKAVLYRVKSAIPPYFIEGVAKSTLGGQTMEGCYEELKHTRPHYTPFSHEILRQKLEDGKSVLKPHSSLSEDAAMEHWVNFLWLATQSDNEYKNEFIHFKSVPNPSYANCDKQQGALGIYSLESEHLGQTLTGELADQKKILILGEKRTEAFLRFSRYCQDILDEHKGYLDRMKHVECCGLARKMMSLTGEQYIKDVLGENWKDMFYDDEDKRLLRQEMEYIDRRRKDFENGKSASLKNKNIVEDHMKDDPDNGQN